MSLVHDNIITSYHVDFENDKLIMMTQFYNNEMILLENTEVVFDGYFTHKFNYGVKGSIIFDIKELPAHLFIKYEGELLKETKNYGWPISYRTDDIFTEFIEFLISNKYKIFVISSSYGTCGFVVSKEMKIVMSKVLTT